jgi:hypothetical protein
MGVRSTLEFPVRHPGAEYRLELLVSGLVAGEKISSQRLDIHLKDRLLDRSSVQGAYNLLECRLPPELTNRAQLLLEFYHPDAVRPCDYLPNRDQRCLAIAFRTLKVIRVEGEP